MWYSQFYHVSLIIGFSYHDSQDRDGWRLAVKGISANPSRREKWPLKGCVYSVCCMPGDDCW